MKFREIFRFELLYQARRVRTWLYFAVLFAAAYLVTRNAIDGAQRDGVLVNSPYSIALATVICSMLWLLVGTSVAGSAAARDIQTRMHPLVYTSPISKAEYLGGRFLAALVLNASILIAVPAGMLVGLFLPGVEPEYLGAFRPAAYVSTYLSIAAPTAFAVTAVQFSLAALSRRATTSYLGSVLFFIGMSIAAGAAIHLSHKPTLGKLLDPIGYITVLGLLSKAWTVVEKNTRLVGLEPAVLARGISWIGFGLLVLVCTYGRFRFAERTVRTRSRRDEAPA